MEPAFHHASGLGFVSSCNPDKPKQQQELKENIWSSNSAKQHLLHRSQIQQEVELRKKFLEDQVENARLKFTQMRDQLHQLS